MPNTRSTQRILLTTNFNDCVVNSRNYRTKFKCIDTCFVTKCFFMKPPVLTHVYRTCKGCHRSRFLDEDSNGMLLLFELWCSFLDLSINRKTNQRVLWIEFSIVETRFNTISADEMTHWGSPKNYQVILCAGLRFPEQETLRRRVLFSVKTSNIPYSM